MSYECGISFGAASLLSVLPHGPRITCDGCGLRWNIPTDRTPPAWFLAGKAPKGWTVTRNVNERAAWRTDLCPRCQVDRK